jgi:hypothetical protein
MSHLAKDGSAFDRALVQAARREGPAEGAEDRALAALALSAALVPAAVAGAGSVPVAGAKAAAWKWLGVASVVGLGVAIVVGLSHSAHAPAAPEGVGASRVAAPWLVADPVPADAPRARAEESLPSPPSSAAPNTPIARPRAVAQPASPQPTSTPHARRSPLAEEVTLLQRGTRAFSKGQLAEAEHVLDTYDAQFPHGALAAEAGFLRVEVLLAQNEPVAAEALARKLLQADPDGVLAPRLEAVLGKRPIP